ncbi:MAG: DNA repair protein RecN [Alphaproteobacteria bacterium MarineAlpha3_Bin3]|nr:MAG: DNA repair protein RecN [Alphaproteobacteria bacterium MarineAlpha3_Bin3]
MLTTLSIREVVLIGRLDLSFHAGLCVLTGETGSGKSILLDALGLALGMRAEARLVRHGADQASVTAVFDLGPGHTVLETLAGYAIPGLEDGLVLRRVLGADGRSKAFINDQPVSVQLLKETGGGLVDVHGQFENQRLLNEGAHRGLLDSFGGLSAGLKKTGDAHKVWKDAAGARIRAEAEMEAARRDEEFLRHALDEITGLDPKPGEETDLARQRTLMMHGEQLVAAMNTAAEELGGDGGALRSLEAALRELERVAEKADGRLADTLDALVRAQSETTEADALLQTAASMDLDPQSLEQAEERLFALRALARKHSTEVDNLSGVAENLAAKVRGLEDGGARLTELTKAESHARAAYGKAATVLSQGRGQAAGKLDKAVAKELKPLKLEKAKFTTVLDDLPEDAWGPEGRDKVVFQVATNPGAPAGPLGKISSGGELARFTLALKAVLAQADPVPTLVFDEVDSGVGGAVAAAVGERLAGLAGAAQVLVVTHSPQVAAKGKHHWLVSKSDADPGVLTTVDALSDKGRKEEIARMLAGAKITEEARAAADSLLEGAGP